VGLTSCSKSYWVRNGNPLLLVKPAVGEAGEAWIHTLRALARAMARTSPKSRWLGTMAIKIRRYLHGTRGDVRL
jgi:hypothetical protein